MAEVCGTCSAPIVWGLTPQGKRAPIDSPPAETGNVMLLAPRSLETTFAITLSGDALGLARERGVPLHLNHWATCPDKAQWRARLAAKRSRTAA